MMLWSATGWWQGYDAMECYRMTYSVPDTYRAVDLLFFRRGEDYTYVGELIGMDYQTVEPTRLASVGPYNYAVMYHLLEEGILTAFPEADAMLRDAPMPLAAQSAAVAYFYSNRPADMTVFFADQAPLQPEGRTMRIDEATYLGLRQLYETYGVVYQLRCSGWEDGGWYAYPEPLWLVFQLGQGGDMTTVLGESVPRKTVEQAALEQGYHLVDGEIALWRDGYPNPAGPGSEVGFFQEEPVVTVLEGAEPIYQAGDWWQQMFGPVLLQCRRRLCGVPSGDHTDRSLYRPGHPGGFHPGGGGGCLRGKSLPYRLLGPVSRGGLSVVLCGPGGLGGGHPLLLRWGRGEPYRTQQYV